MNLVPLHRPDATTYSLGDLIAKSLDTPRSLHAVASDGAELYLSDGEVIHARRGELEGAAAVYAILDDHTLRFRVVDDRPAPRRSVVISWRRLCHEARAALLEG
jgi:hypothetical protein